MNFSKACTLVNRFPFTSSFFLAGKDGGSTRESLTLMVDPFRETHVQKSFGFLLMFSYI